MTWGGGGCEKPKLEICLHLWEQPCTPTEKGTLVGKGAEATGPRPCPDPGLEAYLTSQANAKEKADSAWGWGDAGFLEVSLETKGLSIHCADNPGELPSSELGQRGF